MVARANRLRSSRDFARARGGARVTAPELVLYHSPREADGDPPRIGFAVSRRIGNAVVRNRTKRILREAFRPLIPRLVACDIVVVARPPIGGATLEQVTAALTDATERAGLLENGRASPPQP